MDSDPTQTQETDSGPKVIRANQFVLEDANGKTRALLDVDKDGVPGLYLYDETATPRVMLGLGTYGSVLAMFDRNGKNRASLAVSNDGTSLRLSDDNGKPRVRLTVGDDGVPGLELLYANGVQLWAKP